MQENKLQGENFFYRKVRSVYTSRGKKFRNENGGKTSEIVLVFNFLPIFDEQVPMTRENVKRKLLT